MYAQLFYPPPRIVATLSDDYPWRTLKAWASLAGRRLKASGYWSERLVAVVPGTATMPSFTKEPGDMGRVVITMKMDGSDEQDVARTVLLAMAYGLHDLPSRATVAGQPWARLQAAATH